jgi:signal peptidase I
MEADATAPDASRTGSRSGVDAVSGPIPRRGMARRWLVLLGAAAMPAALVLLAAIGADRPGGPAATTAAGLVCGLLASAALVEAALLAGAFAGARLAGARPAPRAMATALAVARAAPVLATSAALPLLVVAALAWRSVTVLCVAGAGAAGLAAWQVVATSRAVRAATGLRGRRAVGAVAVAAAGLGLLGLVGLPLRSVLDPYEFTTGSMKPTTYEGDHALVDRAAYGLRVPGLPGRVLGAALPAKGDRIVFRSPDPDADPTHMYMKRVVAVAGDRVGLFGDRLYVEGRAVPTLIVDDDAPCEDAALSPCHCVRQQEVLGAATYVTQHVLPHDEPPICMNLADWPSADPMRVDARRFHLAPVRPVEDGGTGVAEAAPGGGGLGGTDDDAVPRLRYDVVPDGSVFVLGDNRDNSGDSRLFGPVPLSDVVGRVTWTYWPLDRGGTGG